MGIDVWVERNPHASNEANTEIGITSAKTSELFTPEAVLVETTSAVEQPAAKTNEALIPLTAVEVLDWDALRSHVAACQNCELAATRTKTIFGAGIKTAALMIVGDAPTEQDENQGDVFSSQAGKLLTAMLKAMGYQRSDVYIANVVKCKTANNQEPTEHQAASCEAYLLRQISLVQPKLILALGKAAAQRLLKSKATMNRLRGQLHYADGVTAPILVSYHPTYLLAAPNEKRKAWEDLQMAMKHLAVKGVEQ
jgi:DNA polymerase